MDSAIRALVQPQIVLVGTILEADVLYIVVEGSVMSHSSSEIHGCSVWFVGVFLCFQYFILKL